jgi:hypothetical protein
MKAKLLLLLAAMLLATGCASSRMVDSAQQELIVPSADKAQVVFLRSSFLGSAIQSVIYDASDGGAEFIGILSNGKKLAHTVEPGKHVFMVVSEAADFMAAEVVGGKTYYAIVTPRMGAWKARFSMYPVRNGGPGEFQYGSDRFQSWLTGTALSENTPDSHAWARENHSSVLQKQADYSVVWQQKSPSELAERTLNPDDGV